MVKLKGPALATQASGTLADLLIFSNWKGRAYLKKNSYPKQPRSGLQVSMRAMLTFLSQQWPNLNPAQQATWLALATTYAISPFNAFQQINLQRWRSLRPPTKTYPAGETRATGTQPRITAAGDVRHVTLDAWLNDEVNYNWTMLLFHAAVGSPAPEVVNLVHVFRIEDASHHYWKQTPLPTGTHYYRVVPASDDGKVNWANSWTDDAVVT